MQRHEVISAIMKQYAGKTPITKQGIEAAVKWQRERSATLERAERSS